MGCSNITDGFLSTDASDSSILENLPTKISENLSPLFSSLGDYSQCSKISPFPKWAEPPATVASKSASMLNRIFSRKKFFCDDSMVLGHCTTVVHGLKEGDDALKQHLVFLLFRVLSKGYIRSKEYLLDLGIIEILTPFLIHKNKQFSICVSRCCELIFGHDNDLKDVFCDNSGVIYLEKQMEAKKIGFFEVKKRLSCLLSLMTDEDGKPAPKYIQMVKEVFDSKCFSKIQFNKLVGRDLEYFNKFLTLLMTIK